MRVCGRVRRGCRRGLGMRARRRDCFRDRCRCSMRPRGLGCRGFAEGMRFAARGLRCRMARRRDAELVRSAGDGLEGDAGDREVVGLACGTLEDSEECACRSAVLVGEHLLGAVRPIDDDGDVDGAFVSADPAFEDGDVGLCDLALHELFAESAVGLWVECEDHEAAGFHVEAVDADRSCGVWESLGDA